MPSFTRLYCEDHDIEVILIPDSPLAARAVDAQPKENLAVRYHGENHQILEILGQTDSSLEERSAAGDISHVIVLRGRKASYTFGSAASCNIRLEFPGIGPEQLEMTLPKGQIGVEVRLLDNKTRLNGEKVGAGKRTLPIEAYMQIGRASFKVIPTSSLVAGCKIYQGGMDSRNSTPDEMGLLSTPSSSPLQSPVESLILQQLPSLADFERGKMIGRGGQGRVYRYLSANEGQHLVVKILPLLDDSNEESKQAIREVMISPIQDHVGFRSWSCFAESLTQLAGIFATST